MTAPLEKHSDLSVFVVRTLFLWFTSIVAALTILSHVGLWTGISFHALAWIILVTATILTGLCALDARKDFRAVANKDVAPLLLLMLLGLLSAVVAIYCFRPHGDDSIYIPGCIHILEHPGEALNFTIPFIDGGSEPIDNFPASMVPPYDYGWAALAYFSGIEFFTVYYILKVALGAFLTALAFYYLLSFFADSSAAAVLGAAVAVAAMLLMGDTLYAFGTNTFPRMFQGKPLAFTIGVPLFAGAVISFFQTRSRRDWLFLFTIATAMLGASTTVMLLMPALFAIFAVAFLVINGDRKKTILVSMAGFASMSCLFLYAAYFKLGVTKAIWEKNNPLLEQWPADFLGQIQMVVSLERPVTLGAFIAAMLVIVLLMRSEPRRFILLWVGGLFLFILNPVVYPLLVAVATTGTYWRFVYLLPVPAFVGIAAMVLFERSRKLPNYANAAVWTAVFAALFALHFPAWSPSIFRAGGTQIMKRPGPKIFTYDHFYANAIIDASPPPGVMLAPERVSRTIPMLTSAYPQVRFFDNMFRAYWRRRNNSEEGELRISASEFVGGDFSKADAFALFLEKYPMRSIVMVNKVFEREDVQKFLASRQYTSAQPIPGMVIVWNPQGSPPSGE